METIEKNTKYTENVIKTGNLKLDIPLHAIFGRCRHRPPVAAGRRRSPCSSTMTHRLRREKIMSQTVRSGGAGTTVKAAVPVSSDSGNIEIILQAIIKNMVTKSDLRTAVKTILRGEDVNAVKPGPRLTPTKRQQIEVVKKYRATHRGGTLHSACIRSFVPAKGGYKSPKAIYEYMRRLDRYCLCSNN